jgi:hypothetical protein
MSSFTESRSFFDVTTSARKVSLLQTQYDPSTPAVQGLDRTTNLLVPDYITSARFDHFPDDLYDLRDHSHLVRFLRALMGDSGAGALRKRYMIARFQQALTSTHFFDLDRFYGAIFGTNRLQSEQLGLNPFVDIATSDEWEQAHVADARFRERIFALAKAIPMGGTVPGLKTAAEAIVGAPCEVLEDWQRIDYQHSHGYLTDEDYQGRTYAQVAAFGTYSDVAAHGTWVNITGVSYPVLHTQRRYQDFPVDGFITYGQAENIHYDFLEERDVRLGKVVNDRGGVMVRPLKTYDTTAAGDSEKAQDEYALRRVLNLLKPAGVRLRIDMTADGLYATRPIAAAYADSEYYEIVQSVSPTNTPQAPVYPLSPGQRQDGLVANSPRILARPPFSAAQTAQWNYANEVVAVHSYAEDPVSLLANDGNDFDRVTDIYGHATEFSGEKGVLDPRQAEAGRLSGDTSLVSHPYAADRVLVRPHA